MEIKIGGRKIIIENVKEVGFFGGIKGLMFSKKENAKVILFNSKNGIHSFFVNFNFLILWLDDKNNVVDWKIVKPWCFHEISKKRFVKFIEVPVNSQYKEFVNFIVERKV